MVRCEYCKKEVNNTLKKQEIPFYHRECQEKYWEEEIKDFIISCHRCNKEVKKGEALISRNKTSPHGKPSLEPIHNECATKTDWVRASMVFYKV